MPFFSINLIYKLVFMFAIAYDLASLTPVYA